MKLAVLGAAMVVSAAPVAHARPYGQIVRECWRDVTAAAGGGGSGD